MKKWKKAASLLLAVSLVAMSGAAAYAQTPAQGATDPEKGSPAAANIGETLYETLDEADWQISKSKEATNLDSSYVSSVTLSLPSAQEVLSTDVVFVLDKSTSTDVEDQIMKILQNLNTQVQNTKAAVKVGIVIFNKEAHRVCELTHLTEESLAMIEKAIRTDISSGTNLHAGLLAGKAMLDEDTATAAGRKYLITVSDGITYLFGEEPTAAAWSWNGDQELNWAGPDNWNSKYGSEEAPTEGWSSWLADMAEKAKGTDWTEYDYPYGTVPEKSTPAAEKMDYANSIDKALYFSSEVFHAAEAEGYHCFATVADQTKGTQYQWGPSFIRYLACGKEVSFTQIQNEICYLLDAGSYVIDKIGKTGEYDFDLYQPETMILKVGEKAYKAVKADVTSAETTAATSDSESEVYCFGEADRNGVFPYVVRYYPESANNPEEYFKWEIHVPVSNLERVSLTYTVRLMNPKTEAGTYGEYDRFGEQNKTALYTNCEATIYPVDSSGQHGLPENFRKPTVSYTVSGSTPVYPVYTSVNAQKIWTLDDGGKAADSVTVQLLKDGKAFGNPVLLSAAKQWRHTWYGLDPGHTYTAVERNVPEGFLSTVTRNGSVITINNDDIKAEEPAEPTEPAEQPDPEKPVKPERLSKPESPSKPGTSQGGSQTEQPVSSVPKTGDSQYAAFWIVLLAVTLAGLGLTLRLGKKQK